MIKKILALFLIVTTSSLISNVTFAKGRADHHIGIGFGVNHNPYPSLFGLNLKIQAGGLLRFTGGYGYTFVPKNKSVGVIMYNITLGWLLDAIFGSLVRAMGAKNFSLFIKGDGASTADTYGGGLKLMVPGWNFSPTVGGNWSSIKTQGNPWGLPEVMQHFYGTAGFDYMSDSGVNVGVDFIYSPEVKSQPFSGGVYFGAFF